MIRDSRDGGNAVWRARNEIWEVVMSPDNNKWYMTKCVRLHFLFAPMPLSKTDVTCYEEELSPFDFLSVLLSFSLSFFISFFSLLSTVRKNRMHKAPEMKIAKAIWECQHSVSNATLFFLPPPHFLCYCPHADTNGRLSTAASAGNEIVLNAI